jgi:3-phosphoshikimate 1-carboxyvinyltransferase
MKTLIINKSTLTRELQVPSSKSQTHRAILLASLAKDRSIVHDPLNSADSLAMIEACRHLGAKIEVHSKSIEIQGISGKIFGAEDVIHAHNSGVVLRFLSTIAALGSQPIVITGDHSIRHQRPMKSLLDSLQQLGARAESTRGDGFAPLIVQGPLKPGQCKVMHGADSQNVSPLLIAGAFLEGTLELEVENPGEKPWIDITLDWLKRLGVPYENHQHEKYKVRGIKSYSGFEYRVPGDWSTASFPIAAALVTQSELLLKNLDIHDLQGDKKIVEILEKMGAHFSIDEKAKTVHVQRGAQLKGITVDINDCIDALPVLAAIACYAEGETRLINAAIARYKECDRIACIASELNKMGASIQETVDGLVIQKSLLKGTQVLSHGDHRIAMSLAVAGMGAAGETHILDTACIGKTYPRFVQDFQELGINIKEKV